MGIDLSTLGQLQRLQQSQLANMQDQHMMGIGELQRQLQWPSYSASSGACFQQSIGKLEIESLEKTIYGEIAKQLAQSKLADLMDRVEKNKGVGMFTKFFTRKLRMELKEIMHQHSLEIKTKEAEFEIKERHWREDKAREITKIREEHQLSLDKLSLNSQATNQANSLRYQEEYNKKVESLNKEHYDKLSAAMSKLHEEGNVATKFQHDLAVEMFKSMPKVPQRLGF